MLLSCRFPLELPGKPKSVPLHGINDRPRSWHAKAPVTGLLDLEMDQPEKAHIDATVTAFYQVFDNRAGCQPDPIAARSLFLETATITMVTAGLAQTWSLAEFLDPRIRILTDGTLSDFHEWETEEQTTICDQIAGRFSKYSKKGTRQGTPFRGAGQKILNLCRTNAGWKISSLIWQDGQSSRSDLQDVAASSCVLGS